ncbi:MAG: J domain-containing protein [Candidatus Hydrogenedentes bacterium]|nr:J domain-containing protein [Candidatus Hydrogenedentota bacterium]
MNLGIQELMMLVLIFAILSVTGLLPSVMQAFRALRGEAEPAQRSAAAAPSRTDVEMCFRLLGLSPSASWEEVEKAYKQKAKRHHPDHGGDDDMMRTLNEAYSILKSVHSRKR